MGDDRVRKGTAEVGTDREVGSNGWRVSSDCDCGDLLESGFELANEVFGSGVAGAFSNADFSMFPYFVRFLF